MVARARRFICFREGAADHDRIRAAGERFANVATFAHPPVGYDRNVTRRLLEVGVARGRTVDRRGDLRHTETQDAARSTGGAGSDADQHCRRTALHDLERDIEANGVADNDGNAHLAAKFFQVERFIFRGNVAHSRNGALDDEYIRASFLRDPAELIGLLRNRTYRSDRAAVFDLLHAGRDKIFLDWFLVNFLEERGDFRFVGFDDFLQNFPRIFVTRLHAFEVENREAAKLAHRDGELHVDDAIHGAGQDRNFQLDRLGVATRDSEGRIDFARIDRDAPRDERDFVEAISHARFAIAADPHSHN